VGDDNQPPGQQTQREEPDFSIIKTVILERDARPREYLFGVFKELMEK
jgi:hypothetical protein